MNDEVQVVLQSGDFGCEIFSYPNDTEAFAAMRRLLATSRAAFQEDGIERTIGILVGERSGHRETEEF